MLEKAVEEIQKDIDEDNDKDSIIGIQAFHFKFLIILFRFMEKIGLLKGRGLYLLLSRMPRETSGKASIVLFLYCWGAFLFFVLLFYLGYGMDEVMM